MTNKQKRREETKEIEKQQKRFEEANKRLETIEEGDNLARAEFYLKDYPEFCGLGHNELVKSLCRVVFEEIDRLEKKIEDLEG